MLPAWLYTLGSVLMDNASIQIPFKLLFLNILIVVVPCLIGFTISLNFPKLREKTMEIAKPVTFTVVTTFLVFVIITKLYTFQLMKLQYFFGKIFLL